MHLMLLGHVGAFVAIPSVILSFFNVGNDGRVQDSLSFRVSVLCVGLGILLVVANSNYVERVTWRLNTWALRRFTGIQVQDYTRLLRISHNFVISELAIRDGSWVAGHQLERLKLASEGVLVLGIEKPGGSYRGAPRGRDRIEAGDCLIVYGRQETLDDLDHRKTGIDGNVAHMLAVSRQIERLERNDRDEGTGEFDR